jgi:hypothetical protein
VTVLPLYEVETTALSGVVTEVTRPAQPAYAYWERHPVALRPDQLLSLAQALNVSVDDLVGTNGTKKRGAGPTGKMKQLFEAASRLPRSQQQKITALLEPFIAHHAQR